MTSGFLILLLTNFMISNRPEWLWSTVVLLLPSQHLIALWAPLHLPGVLGRIACFSVLRFGFISSFTSNLNTFHPKGYYFFWHYLLLPYFLLLLSVVSLTHALGIFCWKSFWALLPLLDTWLSCWLMRL